MSAKKKYFVGSRKSELALIQTNYVINLLKGHHPDYEFEIVTMSTLGDNILDIPLPKIGEKSLFTKELEAALSCGGVDFVVHSLKDLPTSLPQGMVIGAVLTREDPRDALVLRQDHDFVTNPVENLLRMLPDGSTIGTSSLRRSAQLQRHHPHLKVENIRGNLNTRLRKLDERQYDGIVLAAAGLKRMGWRSRISSILDNDDWMYAVGQGALAVECRADDGKTLEFLRPLYDAQTGLSVLAERSFLSTLGGGCSAPVAVTTSISPTNINQPKQIKITLKGAVWSLDGATELTATDETTVECCDSINRCRQCPFNNTLESETSRDIEDIPIKRLKLDVTLNSKSLCPYLEAGGVVGLPLDGKKCPFLKRIKNTDPINSNFCGLTPHYGVGMEAMRKIERLGVRLAEDLIAKGGQDIIKTAQAIINQKSVN